MESKAMLTRNSMALEAQVEERPLAKKQEALLGSDGTGSSTPPGDPSPGHPKSDMKAAESPKAEKVPRKALLKNDDTELQRVGYVCISHIVEVVAKFITATWGSPSSLLYLI
jgi:RNA polymerase II subunit A-like phosphatase